MRLSLNLLLILSLSLNSCSKQDDCENPVDCLPPATQIGANTAGCLVDGKVLLPKGRSLNSGSVFKAQYSFSFNEGRYIFSLTITDRTGEYQRTVHVESKNDNLEEGNIYVLKELNKISTSAYYLLDAGFVDAFETTDEITGELKITHLDEIKNIISGTFWFDAINNEGEIVKVREGRFDVRY
jgi:hypothetical protein